MSFPVILGKAVYLLLLLVGSIGFVAMTLLGFAHGGAGRLHHASVGHAPTAGHGPGMGAHHTGAHASGHSGSQSNGGGRAVRSKSFPAWLMISPMDIFSFSLGAGAVGQIFHPFVSATALIWCAVIGALAFNLGIVKPTMSFMMRFVSKPSEGLEGTVAKTAEAVTRFDDKGRGLVKVNVDDQVVQLLATLEDADLHHGVKVNKGDEVVIVEVDSAKNTCRVSKEL